MARLSPREMPDQMLMHGWSIALSICSSGILFLVIYGAICGTRVLRFWEHGSDTLMQIRLEGETWLVSAIMQYVLAFQVLSLLLLVLAADSFSSILIGAMCSTGAFMANSYGIPALISKIGLLFLSGFWLLLHRLDMQSESYPLIRVKNIYLLFLVPLLLVDVGLQSAYLFLLEPDVITSCCGVIFQPGNADGFNLLDPVVTPVLLMFFYGLSIVLLVLGAWIYNRMHGQVGYGGSILFVYSCLWALFFIVALWAITVFFSSYIYAIPSHRCPFDILQQEYGYIGYPIYFTLFAGTFFGCGCGITRVVQAGNGLNGPVIRFQLHALRISLLMQTLFLIIISYAPLRYLLGGGEF